MMSTSIMEFIGRKKEIEFLTKWLADVDAPSIVYIHDALEKEEKKGGIGKTWLLHRFLELVEREHRNIIPVLMDFFLVQDRDSVAIDKRVAQALKKP